MFSYTSDTATYRDLYNAASSVLDTCIDSYIAHEGTLRVEKREYVARDVGEENFVTTVGYASAGKPILSGCTRSDGHERIIHLMDDLKRRTNGLTLFQVNTIKRWASSSGRLAVQ